MLAVRCIFIQVCLSGLRIQEDCCHCRWNVSFEPGDSSVTLLILHQFRGFLAFVFHYSACCSLSVNADLCRKELWWNWDVFFSFHGKAGERECKQGRETKGTRDTKDLSFTTTAISHNIWNYVVESHPLLSVHISSFLFFFFQKRVCVCVSVRVYLCVSTCACETLFQAI